MSCGRRPAHYGVVPGAEVLDDVVALAGYGPEVVAAAASIFDDLAHGRVGGKDLGLRHVSGDLSGLVRVKVDVPGWWPPRLLGSSIDRSMTVPGRSWPWALATNMPSTAPP